MKTIGILGGLGPQATTDFIDRIHRSAQQLIPQKTNAGYPELFAYYCTFSPMLFDNSGRPVFPLQADPRLLEAAKKLGSCADFIVIPSNTPHLFQSQIEAAAGCSVLSLIDVTLEEVKRRQCKNVGVLGFREPREYLAGFELLGIDYLTPSKETYVQLRTAVFATMEGRAGKKEKDITEKALQNLREKGADSILLGCSELPLLLPKETMSTDVINPAQLLAEAAIAFSLKE